MSLASISAIVVGSLNTDIVGLGFSELIGAGEVAYGNRLQIGAGGKSRNTAEMMAAMLGPDRVAMVGKSSRDPLSLWRYPVDALEKAGVNIDFVRALPFEETGKFPGIALIPVDRHGHNQIYVLPGVNDNLTESEIDAADPLFEAARSNRGALLISLELPVGTALHAIKKAHAYDLKVLLDPGGLRQGVCYDEILDQRVLLIKPNQHELRMLTGVEINSVDDARSAASILRARGMANVLVTLGKQGAFMMTESDEEQIPAPDIAGGDVRDETGCGDQAMAALCAFLTEGKDLRTAARAGVMAGTLQFYRAGIVPITRAELLEAMSDWKQG